MSMRRLLRLVSAILLVLCSAAQAEDIIMTRSVLPFPEAMLALQQSIGEHGYTLSRVQRIDIGC